MDISCPRHGRGRQGRPWIFSTIICFLPMVNIIICLCLLKELASKSYIPRLSSSVEASLTAVLPQSSTKIYVRVFMCFLKCFWPRSRRYDRGFFFCFPSFCLKFELVQCWEFLGFLNIGENGCLVSYGRIFHNFLFIFDQKRQEFWWLSNSCWLSLFCSLVSIGITFWFCHFLF